MGEFKLKRVNGPILQPISHHPWESRAVFNPGTVSQDEIVHMLYRAVEGENFSSIGYAKLNTQGEVKSRFEKPVIKRELGIEKQGCEDPRIVSFLDKYYIFYSAGCTSNKFEHSDAIAEHHILNTNGGAVAYIGNSRYGWYYSGSPGSGPSDNYDKEFYKRLFADDYDHIGETLAMSKQTYIPNSGSLRESLFPS